MKQHIVPLQNIDLLPGGFWTDRTELIRKTTMWNVYKRFSETGRFEAFHFTWKEGMENKPHIFWDSDVAKWMEAAAYLCLKQRDPALEAIVDDVTDAIEKNRMADGYFNSYYGLLEPQNRFTVRNNHELYCCGHLIEAAIAYRDATGKDKLFNLMRDYADLVYQVFYVDKSASFTTPGHEEIELALVKLYRATGDKRYLDLALYFVETRGVVDEGAQVQSHLPIREQKTAEGHSVRACYFFSAVADLALETGDETLKEAAKTLFDNIVSKRMYVTGAIGQTSAGEAFMGDYDLPNQSAYAETCANLSLSFFARRMSLLEPDSVYADTAERVLYNSFLSGMSLDGRAFFYSNMQENQLTVRGRKDGARPFCPADTRVEVFGCSCCPPNVVRAIASVTDYMMSTDGETVWLHQFMPSKASFDGREIKVWTDYPYGDTVKVRWTGKAGRLAIRIPGWCPAHMIAVSGGAVVRGVERGYAMIDMPDSGEAILTMDMPVQMVEADPRVWEDAGRVAVTRGPLVYCLEAVDNAPEDGRLLRDIRLDENAEFETVTDETLGVPVLKTVGYVRDWGDRGLYAPAAGLKEVPVTLIPYYAIANRGESDMVIWTLKK